MADSVVNNIGDNDAPGANCAENDDSTTICNPSSTTTTTTNGFTLKQWILLITLGVINVIASMVYSIQAPFFPAEAETKGCTATEYGLVFGSYELTIFLMCPIIGSCMYKIGCKFAYHFGLILTAISTITFGLTPYLEAHDTFLVAAFALRILEAVGASIVFIATSTIVTMEFPDAVATVFAVLELSFGVGLSLGPPVGSIFYNLEGFSLPFFVVGGTLLALNFAAFFIIKSDTDEQSSADDDLPDSYGVSNNNNCNSASQQRNRTRSRTRTESYSSSVAQSFEFLDLLKIPKIILYTISNLVCAISSGFMVATLEPHIRTFKLHSLMTGLLFLLYGGVYASFAPLVGRLCDRIAQPVFVTLLGSILIFGAFLLIGPAPFFPIQTLLSLTIVGLILYGLGLAQVYVSTFILILKESKKNGFPDSSTTASLVSALWMSEIAFGCFIGPSLAGVLVDNYGFRVATCLVTGLEVLVIILLVVHVIRINSPCGGREEDDELSFIDNNEASSLLQTGRR